MAPMCSGLKTYLGSFLPGALTALEPDFEFLGNRFKGAEFGSELVLENVCQQRPVMVLLGRDESLDHRPHLFDRSFNQAWSCFRDFADGQFDAAKNGHVELDAF